MEEERMTLEGFMELSLTYRAQYLWAYGSKMTIKVFTKYAFTLYQLEDFFVEVTYSSDENKITSIEAFDNTEHLLGYVDDIQLNHIL
ncbi:hypothetical protein WJR50_32990 [Catalinimonas sp. 4WD22]|uniref:hypothetical protein n=1 Tax=Catalinimonas locisalis TaxID=3133978 RepID=UPI003101B3C9